MALTIGWYKSMCDVLLLLFVFYCHFYDKYYVVVVRGVTGDHMVVTSK